MPRSPRRPAGEPPMRHSRRRAETSSRGLDGRRNEFLEAPRDAPRTRPGEVVRRRPRGVPDGARRKPWRVATVTLHEHLREPPGHQRQAPRRPRPGGFRRPFGQSLGTRRHGRSEGSQPTPSVPPGRSSAEVRETLAEPLGGLPHDPPRGLAERLQELGHDPLRRPDRPPQQRPPHPPRSPDRPPQHAHSAPSERSYKDPSGQLHEPRPPPSTEPRRPPQYARSVRSEKGLRKTPRDHCELDHHPPQRPPRRPQHARSAPSEKVV